MHGLEAGAVMGMFAHASRFKYGQFRRQMGSHIVKKGFRLHVHWSHVLRPSSAAQSL